MANHKIIAALRWLIPIGAVIYVSLGVHLYVAGSPNDIHSRWREAGYVMHGYDPIKVARDGEPILEEYGRVNEGEGYPPWSYLYAQFLVPPALSFSGAKWVFLIINLAAIVLLALPIRRAAKELRADRDWALLYAAIFCCSAIVVALRHGQYGVLTAVFLWYFLYFESTRRQPFLAGLFLALAAIKPQIAALFFLLPLTRKSFRTCLWCVLLSSAATGIVALQCQTQPWVLLSEMLETGVSNSFYMGIADPLKYRVGQNTLLLASTIVFGAITFFLLLSTRHASVFETAAIPAVFSKIWMSHRTHDLMIISFLLIPILVRAVRNSQNGYLELALAVGLTYWIPHLNRFYLYPIVPLLYRLFWLCSLCFLHWESFRRICRRKAGDPTQALGIEQDAPAEADNSHR